jgi:hypothetical protein
MAVHVNHHPPVLLEDCGRLHHPPRRLMVEDVIWIVISCVCTVRATLLAYNLVIVHSKQSFHEESTHCILNWTSVSYTWQNIRYHQELMFRSDYMTQNTENGLHVCACGCWSVMSTTSVAVCCGWYCLPLQDCSSPILTGCTILGLKIYKLHSSKN